ncbi:HNH endonuclease [Xenorhabdus bovienii]|uniref:HNH endonuclease n=1 Tax=Xenorhabdus bovienii TaxID=40576 RepID=UPI0023B2CF5D|nr:HNH endonuclease [Xenorhabdus bovienii]MDE9444779.1 HNH endonuclease [Xenorhabdus bovienii]
MNYLPRNEVINTLIKKKFYLVGNPERTKATQYRHNNLRDSVYVKKPNNSDRYKISTHLVISPEFEKHLDKILEIPRVSRLKVGKISEYRYNTGYTTFPKRKKEPENVSETNYGFDFAFSNNTSLNTFLDLLITLDNSHISTFFNHALAPHNKNEKQSIDKSNSSNTILNSETIESSISVIDTEREALIKARIGQNSYREALLNYWGGCAVTGCDEPDMLRASHIKPWKIANATERLDKFNGLLLTPNLDVAFDQGLITFSSDGTICISSRLKRVGHSLGIHEGLCLKKLGKQHIAYLKWHRINIFKE